MNTAYDKITERIIQSLEKGVIPWKKPWISALPMNLVSKKTYRGMNILLLGLMNFKSPYWLTFKQAKELKGSVKEKEHGMIITYWNRIKRLDDDGNEKIIPFLKYYYVFNTEQCELPEGLVPIEAANPNAEPLECCQTVIEEMPKCPKIVPARKASYCPSMDFVEIPDMASFFAIEGYYASLFHELIHSTGHKSRLDRPMSTAYGSEEYSKEELIAEIGASFLCGHCGIEPIEVVDNTTAYIQGWLKALDNDKKLVIMAAAASQKAVDFILNVKFENGNEPKVEETANV